MHPDFTPVTSLADALFQRERLLTKEAIDSFVPRLRFQESFCETDEELREYRESRIQFKKREIWWNEEAIKINKILHQEGDKRALQSGNRWDAKPTRCERRSMRINWTDGQEWFDRKRTHDEQAERLWQNEIERFSVGFAGLVLSKKKNEPSCAQMYKRLLGDKLAEFGFEPDKDLTTTVFLRYKKNISDSYKLCWSLDLFKLRTRPDPSPSTTTYKGIAKDGSDVVVRHAKGLGVPLEMWLSFGPIAADKKTRHPINIPFDSVFPIGGQYRYFWNFQELEALANIYLTMYGIIEKDLNAACLESIS